MSGEILKEDPSRTIRNGGLVKIRDNGKIVTHHTPRWSYGEMGHVVRLNDQTITISLLGRYEGEKVRADYADVEKVAE